MKVLVVYHSRTGHTQRLAQQLAQALGAELATIEEQRPAQGALGWLRTRLQAALGHEPPIRPPRRSPEGYDLVLVGTPVLGWRLAPPVRSFARAWRGRLPEVAFFATSNGADARPALDELRRLLGRPPLAELVIEAEAVGALPLARGRSQLRQFVGRLQAWQQRQDAVRGEAA